MVYIDTLDMDFDVGADGISKLTDTTRLRFRSNANSIRDQVYLINIRVQGVKFLS
jgi:hypothetical protein